MVVGPGPAQDLHLLLGHLVTRPVGHAERVELHLEVADAEAEDQPVSGHVLQRIDHQREQQRMAMRDQRTEAKLDLRGHRADRRQRDERIDKGVVGAFHAVRMEDEVVAHEHRIEAQRFRLARAVEQFVLAAVRAEMRQQQSILSGHNRYFLLRDRTAPRRPTGCFLIDSAERVRGAAATPSFICLRETRRGRSADRCRTSRRSAA